MSLSRNAAFDGVLVYFGYPQGHEDDAERVLCALGWSWWRL
jgi:hypothetical protein